MDETLNTNSTIMPGVEIRLIPKNNKVVIILSGGLDSTTLLYRLLEEGKEVYALTFNYGQKHVKEIAKAKHTCKKLGVNYRTISIKTIGELIDNSALTNKDLEIPEGHYQDENQKKTVVPNRNMIMASVAIGYAVNIGAGAVALGVHSGDHAIYPDCRPEFINLLKQIALISTYTPIEILTPYLLWDKGDIVRDGLRLKVNYRLTWTCYKGNKHPCGVCGSCIEREEAFTKNGAEDPLKWPKVKHEI